MVIHDFVLLRHTSVLVPNPVDSLWFLAVVTWVVAVMCMYGVLSCCTVACKHHPKNREQHKRDLMVLLYVNIAFAIIGGLGVRIERAFLYQTLDGILLIPVFIAYLLVYTILFQQAPPFTLSQKGTKAHWLFCIVCGVIVALFFASLLFNAYYANILIAYGPVVGALILIHGLFMYGSEANVHIHHWSYPIPFIFLSVFDSYSSFTIQIAALAIHVHGVTLFGVEDVFRSSSSC